jgi:hypothetical protein
MGIKNLKREIFNKNTKYFILGILLTWQVLLPRGYFADSKDKVDILTKSVSIRPALQLPGDLIVSRRAPAINGTRVEGNIRVLLPESFSVNSNAVVTGSIYVPGTPRINRNGNGVYRGTITGTGNPQPTNHTINLNANTTLNHIFTQTDAIELPTVPIPPTPQGTRDVSLNQGQSPGDFSTIRNLTINSNYGQLEIPEGTYGNFVANSNSIFVFGIEGQATNYNLTGLTLNSNSQLIVRGSVTINLLNQINLNSNCKMGNLLNPVALALNVARGGLTLNSNSEFYGVVTAPTGTFSINSNSKFTGLVICDRATLNANSLLKPMVSDTTGPGLTVAEPTENQVIATATTNITGTVDDDSVVTSVKVNGSNATINNNSYSLNNFPLTLGTNTLNVIATDIFGNTATVVRTVTRSDGTNQAPVVDAGNNQTITLPNSASLNGNVTDDGFPQPANLSISWSKVSGDGNVTFSSPTSAQTTVTFSSAGTYVLKLTASDGELTGEDTVTITVNPAAAQNQPPIVDAGANQSITLPNNSVNLLGQVTDDGLPNPPAQTTVLWSKKDGNGTVTFSSPNSLATTATFSNSGTYTLTLTASDSELQSSDDVVITVNPEAQNNVAPTVSAGPDQTITLPSNATLSATATDDGLPNPPAQLTVSWSKLEGNGAVTFSAQTSLITEAMFSQAGTYLLRISVTDGELISTDEISVIVNAAAVNQAPIVDAGDTQNIVLPSIITLTGTAQDDGLPNNTLTYLWQKVSGPGEVEFETANELSTVAIFDNPGAYTVSLTVSDGALQTTDIVTLNLNIRARMSINCNPDGFDPDELSVSAGEKVLTIRNRSGEDINYVFTQGATSLNVLAPAGKNIYLDVNLVVGTAQITAVGHPDFNCTITVTP